MNCKRWQIGVTKSDSSVDYKCEKSGLQSAIGCGWQSATKWITGITKCIKVDYKVWPGL